MEYRLARANMVWKREGKRVILMARDGIYVLNEAATRLWEEVHGKTMQEVEELIEREFSEHCEDAKRLLKLWMEKGFVEEVPWMCFS
jgi:hypothetical protein